MCLAAPLLFTCSVLTYLFRQPLRQGFSFIYRVRDLEVESYLLKGFNLSIRAVIVDLPGVQDSDAARTAVDDNCLTKCTDIWIVSPIARAVDGNVAKSLLGESFKRQLILDNNISR